jgi:hypothetical protein
VVHSSTTFSWFGKRSPQSSSSIRRALTVETGRNYLVYNLQLRLYSDFYCRGFAAPSRRESDSLPAFGSTSFIEALSAANSGKGYWEQGWAVRAIEKDHTVIGKEDLEIWGTPEDCLVPGGAPIIPGTLLSLRFPKESLNVSPGFYMAMSDIDFAASSSPLVRLYWNLTAEGAVLFLRSATLLMNQAGLRFKLKVLNDPAQFIRCDSSVLYIHKEDYRLASRILKKIHVLIRMNLLPGTPAFTKFLAYGVGLAEDPGDGNSFGMQRCKVLADGLVCAFEQGRSSKDERLEVVVSRFVDEGISVEKPFLNPESNDEYDSWVMPRHLFRIDNSSRDMPNTRLNAHAFLETAHNVGLHLSQHAIWHEDCCSWMGAESSEQRSSRYRCGGTFRALGPDLYSGTSGIAFFLIALYAATRDAELRRTALGAIRHALSQAAVVSSSERAGLYTGWIGIALVAAYGSIILFE